MRRYLRVDPSSESRIISFLGFSYLLFQLHSFSPSAVQPDVHSKHVFFPRLSGCFQLCLSSGWRESRHADRSERPCIVEDSLAARIAQRLEVVRARGGAVLFQKRGRKKKLICAISFFQKKTRLRNDGFLGRLKRLFEKRRWL